MSTLKTGVKTSEVPSRLPDIVPASVDEQIVVVRKGDAPFKKDGRPVVGPVVETHGGIRYIVGESRQLGLRGEDPGRVKRVLDLEEFRRRGVVEIMTPAELFDKGVDGDRKRLGIVFTSGGEASSIGVNLAETAREMSKTHVVLGVWQGFGGGILPRDEFKRQLVVINDPGVLDRISHTGGSPFGMSRTEIKPDSPEMERLLGNVSGVGFVDGTGGGDHTRNFKTMYEASKAKGQGLVVGITPKSMDNDLSLKLDDGSTVNSLMLGYPSTAHVMRRHWFDEFQSAAGAGKGVVGFFFSRRAGWTILGAIRCDEAYKQRMREDGVLTADLENKMDALGPRQIGLVPEYPVSIPRFVEEVNRRYNEGRDKTVGVAVSEGFMFIELDQEYGRLRKQIADKSLTGDVLLAKASKGEFDDLIQDVNLRKVFKAKPDVAKEFFSLAAKPRLDAWGHPYITVMPKIVDAVVNVLTPVKTNYLEIRYEARTGETITSDRALAEETGRLKAEKIKAGESGVTTVVYEAGEDPLLIDPRKRKPVFIPFERIQGFSEAENNLLQLDPEYLSKCGILIPPKAGRHASQP